MVSNDVGRSHNIANAADPISRDKAEVNATDHFEFQGRLQKLSEARELGLAQSMGAVSAASTEKADEPGTKRMLAVTRFHVKFR